MKLRKLIAAMALLTCTLTTVTACTADIPTAEPTATATSAPTSEPTNPPVRDLAQKGTASAFRSEEGHGPEMVIDGDDSTYFLSKLGLSWVLTFDEPTTFNTVRVRFDGQATAWSVQYRGPLTDGKFIDVPGAVKNYQTAESVDMTFCVNPVEATDVQIMIYNGSSKIQLYTVELYNNEGQTALDSMNSYITERRNRVLSLINRGDSVFNLFPASNVEATNTDNWTTTIERDSSKLFFNNSKWAKGLDETTVFDTQITHTQTDDPSLNWTMRVGLGGQVYSFEAGGLGELVPLQCSTAEWMDEVWQIVVVSHSRMFDRAFCPATHFIHQAGMYKELDKNTDYGQKYMDDTFYGPRLADKWDEEEKSFSLLSLGVTPSYNISRSDTLFYTEITDKGDGVIEFLYGIANYSDNKLDFMNLPWGGVSHDRLPDIIIANPDNSVFLFDGTYNGDNTYAYSKTNGWMGYTQDINDPNSFTVAFVLGNDGQRDETIKRDNKGVGSIQAFYAGNGLDNRDYNVLSTIVTDNVYTDELYWCRVYCIIGKLSDVKVKAAALADKVRYGILRPDTAEKQGIVLGKDDGKDILLPADVAEGNVLFNVYKTHVEGSRPLYLLYDVEKERYIVSVDPYTLSTKLPLADYQDVTLQPWKRLNEKENSNKLYCVNDGKTEFMGILGYVMLSENLTNAMGWQKLSDVIGKELFPGTGYHDNGVMVMK